MICFLQPLIAHYRKDGTFHKMLDVSLMDKYGFKPSITLDKGLDLTINSYCKEKLNISFDSIENG